MLIVRRSSLVLDFALTLQFIHLLLSTFYERHLPRTVLWWTTHIVECCILVWGGRYFCVMRELRPIEFGSYEMVSMEEGGQNGSASGGASGSGGGGGSSSGGGITENV